MRGLPHGWPACVVGWSRDLGCVGTNRCPPIDTGAQLGGTHVRASGRAGVLKLLFSRVDQMMVGRGFRLATCRMRWRRPASLRGFWSPWEFVETPRRLVSSRAGRGADLTLRGGVCDKLGTLALEQWPVRWNSLCSERFEAGHPKIANDAPAARYVGRYGMGCFSFFYCS